MTSPHTPSASRSRSRPSASFAPRVKLWPPSSGVRRVPKRRTTVSSTMRHAMSALRFWLSLAVAYMVLVTLLAAEIARDPRARVHLMPILAAGKATSSLTCLGYFVASSPTFVYLLNALVDGSLALIVLAAWAVV